MIALRAWLSKVLLVSSVLTAAPLLAAEEGPLQREEHAPETHLRFIEGLMARKFNDMAEAELRAFLERNPDHKLAPEAMFRLVECLRAQDDQRATISTISQFQARWPEHELAPKLHLLKGEMLLRAGEIDQAQACFKLLGLTPDLVTREAALYFLAQCYARQEKVDLALSTYSQVAEQPFDEEHQYRPYALFSVAAIFQHKGEAAAAEKAYQRIKDEKNVPAALREEALYRLGEARFSREEYKQAVELYELLLTEFPEGVFAREVRKRRAWACFCLKDYARAVELATEWRSRYGDVSDYEMDYVFGASLVGKELYADAVPLFERLAASARAPDEYRRLARYHQSYCLLRLDRYAAVVEAGTSFLKDYPQGPGHADVRYFLGEACFGLKDYKRAADELNRATQEAGGQWPYLMSASLRLTESLEKAGDLKAAAAVNRRLADDKQVSERAFFLLKAGECERTAGDGDAAVRDFERLLAEYPQAGEVRTAVLHLGELYAERKDYGRAEQLIGDLLSRHQQTEGKGKAKLLFFLGYLCFQQSKFAEAEESLRAALAAGGGPEVSQDARYYLGGTLIELHREDEALDLFAEFLALPEAERPVFSDSLLSRLDALYFARNRYDVSESINRWLMAWKDPEVVDRASLRLAQILVAQSRLPDARALLEGLLARKEAASATDPNCGEILSLLGEVLMSAGQNDPAVSMFERSLKVPGLSVEGAARSRWGLGEILRKESRLNQALHHAVNAFVLCDDPTYTPRAMLLAIGILAETGRTEQAQTTCRELQVRFPSFYEQRRGDPLIQKLGTDAPAAPKQP